MLTDELLRLRLVNQQLARPELSATGEVVGWLGAVQAQDYLGAKWAVGQRLCGATDDAVERAYAEGSILRTHVLRPTWHFVTPSDIRWLLALTAPRIKSTVAHYDRVLGVDKALIARSNSAIARALGNGENLTRAELDAALRGAGIVAQSGQMLYHLLMHAELEAVICSGPRRGKQLTYALLDARAPAARVVDRDEALAELAARYFASHGPATARDFAWWSGLTLADATRALEINGSRLAQEPVDGVTYWFMPATPPPMTAAIKLLPNFDEYTIAYKDRDLFYDPRQSARPARPEYAPFNHHVILLEGRVAGWWKRTLQKEVLVIEADWFSGPSNEQRAALAAAAGRYGAFLGLPVELVG